MNDLNKLENLLKAGDDLLKRFLKGKTENNEEIDDNEEREKNYDVEIEREDLKDNSNEEEGEEKYLMEDDTEEDAEDDEEPVYEDEDEAEEEEENDIDEEKFLKYLKKYATKNKEKLEKLLKETGVIQKSFNKEYSKFKNFSDENVDGVIFDGSAILKSFKNYVDYSSKVLAKMYKDIQELKEINSYQAAITHKSSKIITKSLKNALSNPNGFYKGYDVSVNLKKYKDITPEKAREALIKAAVLHKDDRASYELTKLESVNYNLSLMGEDSLNYIKSIMEVQK
jgi:hypothetical protein